MRSSSFRMGVAALCLAWAREAHAQQALDGFSSERLYRSAAGATWIVMDGLDTRRGLGGAVAMSLAYAHTPWRIGNGSERTSLIAHSASAAFGFAITYEQFRFHLDLDGPILLQGRSGVVGGYALTAPAIDPSAPPDAISDVRVGSDAVLYGEAHRPLRLGIGAQLWIPNGERAEYITDKQFRAMVRVLVAGDVGPFTYAAHLGVHIRPLDDGPLPGRPRGSEQLFGVAAGVRMALDEKEQYSLVVGPELYGETAYQAPFHAETTGMEGLLTGSLESTDDWRRHVRAKLGVGPGLHAHFGAPAWRIVCGLELFGDTGGM